MKPRLDESPKQLRLPQDERSHFETELSHLRRRKRRGGRTAREVFLEAHLAVAQEGK